MIPQQTVDLILDTARIEDVVSDFVSLKRRGANFVACCPFHNEKTPSFYVSPSKGIFKCFGCGKAGSAVSFVMEHEHVSYVEALRYLARKYHIEIVEKEETAEEIAARQRSESLLLVSEFAQKFFVENLDTPEGRSLARAYYRRRGLEDGTLAEFGLGWAPSDRHALTKAALAAGYKEEYLVDSGLCIRYDDGSLADRFHERVMFPIHSLSGRVIAFSGRTLRSDDAVAKYVNSPETEIYVKSRNLYGIWLAKSEIAKAGCCYLLEGNVDVVTMHQLGIRNVVASCGTSLTVEQVRMIRKFTENVTVMYDGDSAGIHAALRAIDLLLGEGLNVKLVLFPDGDDPDSFCRKHTLEEVRSFIASAEQDFIDYMADRTDPGALRDPVRRANLINGVADTVARIPDAVKRSVYVEAAAAKFAMDPKILFQRISATREKLRAAQRQEEERARRRQAADLPPLPEDEPYYVRNRPEEAGESQEENKTVGQAERELLWFILTHGRDILDFDTDSEFYSGSEAEKPTVAEFIRASLDADGSQFYNSIYRDAYNAYFALYDKGLSQEDIIRDLLNGGDRRTAALAARLAIEKYELTVENFARALTTTSSWLVQYVPKAILSYAERKIEDRLLLLRGSLKEASPEEEAKIMAAIVRLQSAQRSVRVRLGRDRERNK